MARKPKAKRLGRPPLAAARRRKPFNLTVPDYAREWLLKRPLGASGQVLAWVDAEIAKEQRQADDYDAAQSEKRPVNSGG